MTLKSAALLALVGLVLLTVVVAMDFLTTVTGVASDVIPVMTLVRSLVFLIASIGLTVFLFVFHRAQR